MKVRVQFTAQLRTALGKAAEEVELPEGSSVAELLRQLVNRFDGAAPHLLKPTGEPQSSLLIVINEAVATTQSVHLRAGDVVTLLPPIAGG